MGACASAPAEAASLGPTSTPALPAQATKYVAPKAEAAPQSPVAAADPTATSLSEPVIKASAAPGGGETPSARNAALLSSASSSQNGTHERKKLDGGASAALHETLLKMSSLMQSFAEARSERTTPIQVVKRVLDLLAADCHASFTCLQTISDNQDSALIVAMLGSPDNYLEQNRLQRLHGKGYAAEVVLKTLGYVAWHRSTGQAAPTDWQALVNTTSLVQLSAIPIVVAEKCVAVLTVGIDAAHEEEASNILWPSYLQLVSASMSNLVKDNSIPKFMYLVKEIHEATELDALFHKLVTHFRVVLGHTNSNHIWYRMALTASNLAAVTVFDDLTQFGPQALQTVNSGRSNTSGSQQGSSSSRLLKDVQANNGVLRSVVNMKNTVMKISVHNRQQVMIPDVQKLINQSGTVSVDIFTTRFIKPPTSVLVFPLKVKQLIFGVIFCMSGVPSDFSDVSAKLRELCEVMSPHLLSALTTGALRSDYVVVKEAVPEMAGSISGSMPIVVGSGMSKGDGGYALGSAGTSTLGSVTGGDASATSHQGCSSTGALVTGLTEKLNQKRIKSAMDVSKDAQMADLQITNLLGEGGFAKVFRGLWQGLVVGIKIVVDDGKNEKMVMKNAHEIAILSTLSHPHVTQAYLCLTDVLVRNMVNTCFRQPHPSVLTSPAYKYLVSMEDKLCHIEVIEYCDLGNLATALKDQVFYAQDTERVLTHLAEAAACGKCDTSTNSEVRLRLPPAPNAKINLRALLLTLIEVASSLGYLHRMGVVHCDVKPANVLLKSSNNDPRGFSIKVSDFGLSRVEDDDSSSSFPFNSCGTAAYVAPEALICNKKVNSSVDVYAFGVLMWEMYTAQRPYGSMKQHQLVEEVVMRGLRPKFPPHAPPAYIQLAQSCWSGSPQLRPSFEEALVVLNGMLQAVDERQLAAEVSLEVTGTSGSVEYMRPAEGVDGSKDSDGGAAGAAAAAGGSGGAGAGGSGHGGKGSPAHTRKQSRAGVAAAAAAAAGGLRGAA